MPSPEPSLVGFFKVPSPKELPAPLIPASPLALSPALHSMLDKFRHQQIKGRAVGIHEGCNLQSEKTILPKKITSCHTNTIASHLAKKVMESSTNDSQVQSLVVAIKAIQATPTTSQVAQVLSDNSFSTCGAPCNYVASGNTMSHNRDSVPVAKTFTSTYKGFWRKRSSSSLPS